MKAALSLSALQLLASYVAALPVNEKSLSIRELNDRDFPWHIGVPKYRTSPAKRQSNLPSTWDPPSDLVKPLQEVWDHEMDTYSEPLTFKNYGFDQVIAGKGKINYCVRWDSSQSVTAAQREQIATVAAAHYNKWIAGLAGFDGWPYESVGVSVVGWAVKDKSLLEGDTSGIDVYTDTDADGIPQCAEACGRYFHTDDDYSGCEAGADRHYDQSLWLTEGLDGGFGGDWGQQVGSEYFLQNIDSDSIHIFLHELGHTFALDDFYDWTPNGVSSFIMLAGSSMEITEFDFWMLRDWWRNLKDRYNIAGTGSSGSGSSSSVGPSSSSLYTIVPTPTSVPVIPTGYPTGAPTGAPPGGPTGGPIGTPTGAPPGGPSGGPTGAFPTSTAPTGTIPTEGPGAGGSWGGNGGGEEGSGSEEGGSWWGSLFGGN